MQTPVIECEQCSIESEDYVCTTCGQTGAEIAESRWLANLWAVIDPETT